MNNNVIVSVCCITYNQEKYISKCLDGIFMQKVNFNFEVIVHDDASTDGTAKIVRNYQAKYNNLEFILQTENKYSKGGKILAKYLFPITKGKYIAICEGDDYWTDPYKLQKQIDFMEANSDYNLIYHRVNILKEETNQIISETNNLSAVDKEYSIIDLAKRNFIHTPSVLIRKSSLDLSFFKNPDNQTIDYSIWMLCSEHGKIKYLADVMAIYRVREGSLWELKDNSFKLYIWIKILLPLLNRFESNKEIFYSLFNQLLESYKILYIYTTKKRSKEEDLKFDQFTKRILIEVKEFQRWWFLYMIHLKKSRYFKLKYFFYLLKNKSLVSIFLLKKCLS